MNKHFLLSCFLFSLLHPLFADERKEIFMERSFHDQKTVEHARAIKQNVRDQSVGMNTFVKDANLSSFNLSPDTFKRSDPKIHEAGKAIGDNARSKQFTGSVKNMQDHVLHDKRLDWSKALDYQKKVATTEPVEKKGILESDERLFVVISSSMPESLVKTYLQNFEPIAADTIFVMRGAIGGAKKIMPTMQWIQKVKKYGDDKFYRCQVDINPNITRRFNIDRVPAVLFVTGFDEAAMTNTGVEAVTPPNEKVFVSYGAIDSTAALQEIQKRSKNDNLLRLIDKIGGF